MDTVIQPVEALPLAKHYMDQLGLAQLFDKHVPNNNGAEIPPAQVLCLMVMNSLCASKPLYQVEHWLADYVDGFTEEPVEAAKYNDDRLGRSLDQLFAADRHSLLTELSASAIRVHALETERVHNDSTSITFAGAYAEPDEQAVQLKRGYNKDHRPECKQLVFGLNITGDGHVPLSFQLYDGNRADVTTHAPNWQALRELLGHEAFIYIADSKLCAQQNLDTIADHGGQFITVVPRNFREVSGFLERVRDGQVLDWHTQFSLPDSRKKRRGSTYRIHEGEQLERGYRVLWIHSATKQALETQAREQRITKSERSLTQIAGALNQRRLKTRTQIEAAVTKACQCSREYLDVLIQEQRTIEQVQLGRGRPGVNTRYQPQERLSYRLEWRRNEAAIARAQRADGLFPLVDNTDLDPAAVLLTYKQQPYLEKRFHTSKSVLEVAPVFLNTPRRIEAMLLLYFIALMLVSLIERQIRQQMHREAIISLPIRASGLKTKAPTWRVIQEFFHGIHLATIKRSGQVLQSVVKGLTARHYQVLKLLNVPARVYDKLRDRWWIFVADG